MAAATALLRPHLTHLPFPAETFDRLLADFRTGALDRNSDPLPVPPEPLSAAPMDLSEACDPRLRRELTDRGRAAIARGRLAVLVMNGGMATRFGGGAKGVHPIARDAPDVSFLRVKVAQARAEARRCDGRIPVVAMQSFATLGDTETHLVRWGLAPDVMRFVQSIAPRIWPDGTPLAADPTASTWPDTLVYAAPGHGDTIGRLRTSGVLSRLRDAGVEHLVVSNVDNLGATPDPAMFGAHLAAVEAGAVLTVEVVPRLEGDAGGCVAHHPLLRRDTIIEGFRLPPGTDLNRYPEFNTNTLWFRLEALSDPLDLAWFPVRKRVQPPDGSDAVEVVQFEQLIGQAADHLPTSFVRVQRAERFLPVKTREEWAIRRPALLEAARRAGLPVPAP